MPQIKDKSLLDGKTEEKYLQRVGYKPNIKSRKVWTMGRKPHPTS
jgi:hypothetical protein